MRQRSLLVIPLLVLFCGMCVVENRATDARPKTPDTRSSSSIYALAGEFRVVFANLLWIKAEQYHHEHTEHGGVWTRNEDLMGLIDLITALDPHFVEAYATGAYVYADGYRDNRRALSYLRQAINNNPRSWELHQIAAVLYAARLHQPEKALPYAKRAVRCCDDSYYKSTLVRLQGTIEKLCAEKALKDSLER